MSYSEERRFDAPFTVKTHYATDKGVSPHLFLQSVFDRNPIIVMKKDGISSDGHKYKKGDVFVADPVDRHLAKAYADYQCALWFPGNPVEGNNARELEQTHVDADTERAFNLGDFVEALSMLAELSEDDGISSIAKEPGAFDDLLNDSKYLKKVVPVKRTSFGREANYLVADIQNEDGSRRYFSDQPHPFHVRLRLTLAVHFASSNFNVEKRKLSTGISLSNMPARTASHTPYREIESEIMAAKQIAEKLNMTFLYNPQQNQNSAILSFQEPLYSGYTKQTEDMLPDFLYTANTLQKAFHHLGEKAEEKKRGHVNDLISIINTYAPTPGQ
jgi:hypothetical protein